MSYVVIEQDLYLKALKKLSKKYKNIESDVENFSEKELDSLLIKQL